MILIDTQAAPGGQPPIPEAAKQLWTIFQAAGEQLYLVGGAVRDRVLGRPGADLDLDFATSAPPHKSRQLIAESDFGKPYGVGERFGTVALRRGERLYEVTTFRGETYEKGSRKPEVRFGATLEEDLGRRDLTINAIAQDLQTGELIDPLGGMRDLHGGVLRAIGEPAARFRDDPLRLLRVARFVSVLGFPVEQQTWEAMGECASLLEHISRERIRDELCQLLRGRHVRLGLETLRDAELLEHSVPALVELTYMPDHGPLHPLSLWDHVMKMLEILNEEAASDTLLWAAVFHDIAKPRTRTHEPNGRPRFFHHEEVGAAMTREALQGLRFPKNMVDDVTTLVAGHMQLHGYSDEWSDGAVRRLMRRMGPLLDSAMQLARADGAAHNPNGGAQSAPKLESLRHRIRQLDEGQVAELSSPLTGQDLMKRYRRPPGPWIREIKDRLEAEVVEGTLGPLDEDRAWELADEMVLELSGETANTS